MTPCTLLWPLLASSLHPPSSTTSPAKAALADLQRTDPKDPASFFSGVLERAAPAPPGVPKVMILGDSWAAVVGIGGNESYFQRKLAEHSCLVHSVSLAIPGSTSSMWVDGRLLDALKVAVATYRPDYVWMTLVGNDALASMPDCAKANKTAAQCGDALVGVAVPNIYRVVDAVHEAHAAARVMGFGYDTMFGGLGCSLITHDVFPQCWNTSLPLGGGGNRCFNTQFLRIQQGWDQIAANRSSFMDQVSILGATQVAAGDPKASTDPQDRHIDMDKMGPRKYWPDYLACFHPGLFPQDSDDTGAMVVMEEFYKGYWAGQPRVCGTRAAAQSAVVVEV